MPTQSVASAPAPPQVDDSLRQSLLGDESLLHKFTDAAGDLAVNLVVGAVILALTLWASGRLAGLVHRAMGRIHGKRAPDLTLQTFVASIVRYGVLIVGLVAVLQQLGVQATSIVAVLGAASLAVGLALQGALSNVAAGVMILLFRPYRVGDIIEVSGRKGTVRALDLFTTEMATADNLKVVIPNGKVFGDIIVNHSFHGQRRVDATFRVPISADTGAVMAGLLARARANPLVQHAPEPSVEITAMGEAWIEVAAHAWTRREDHPAVLADLLLAARLIGTGKAGDLPPLPAAPVSPEPGPGPKAGRRSLRSRSKA